MKNKYLSLKNNSTKYCRKLSNFNDYILEKWSYNTPIFNHINITIINSNLDVVFKREYTADETSLTSYETSTTSYETLVTINEL